MVGGFFLSLFFFLHWCMGWGFGFGFLCETRGSHKLLFSSMFANRILHPIFSPSLLFSPLLYSLHSSAITSPHSPLSLLFFPLLFYCPHRLSLSMLIMTMAWSKFMHLGFLRARGWSCFPCTKNSASLFLFCAAPNVHLTWHLISAAFEVCWSWIPCIHFYSRKHPLQKCVTVSG